MVAPMSKSTLVIQNMCFVIFLLNFSSSNELPISVSAKKIADVNNFVIQAYKFDAIKEDLRKPRIVRIGAIQNSIAAATTAPVSVQRDAVFEKIGKLIEAAAAEKVNILCLQELWSNLNYSDNFNELITDNKLFLFS